MKSLVEYYDGLQLRNTYTYSNTTQTFNTMFGDLKTKLLGLTKEQLLNSLISVKIGNGEETIFRHSTAYVYAHNSAWNNNCYIRAINLGNNYLDITITNGASPSLTNKGSDAIGASTVIKLYY